MGPGQPERAGGEPCPWPAAGSAVLSGALPLLSGFFLCKMKGWSLVWGFVSFTVVDLQWALSN